MKNVGTMSRSGQKLGEQAFRLKSPGKPWTLKGIGRVSGLKDRTDPCNAASIIKTILIFLRYFCVTIS